MQKRPKVIFGVSTAVGALIAATGLLSAGPAAAATVPTFDVPPIGVGWGDIVLTGTATPNTEVHLRERAYTYTGGITGAAQLERAEQWFADKPTLVRSDASGRWAITRTMDSGFLFAVDSGGEYSRIVKAPLRVGVGLTATAGAAGVVDFVVRASPDQPGLEGVIQRYTTSGWERVATGVTDETDTDGAAQIIVSATNQPAGPHRYRALLQDSTDAPGYADAGNLLLANYSANVSVTVAGSSPVAGPVPPANPTPAVPADAVSPAAGGGAGPQPAPAPTAKPSPSKPAPAKPPTPPAGSIQFTRIQYDAPGKDTTRNASVNGEYFKITNRMRKTTFSLKGWTVRDRAGNLYRFTTDYRLPAGKSVVVRTGKGANSSATRYWNKKKHVWNNGGDAATLRTDADKTIDTCKWSKLGKGYTTC